MVHVWVPYRDVDEAARRLGGLPAGLEVDCFTGAGADLPASADDVRLVVLPYMRPGARVLAGLPALEVVQTLTAGVDDVLPHLAPGVTLCNAAGVHDASTAELALALILASGRHLDVYARQQERGEWHPVPGTALADLRVLILGHGRIGQAIEARLRTFEVASVTRVARRPRTDPAVHGTDELLDLLPDVDVLIVIAPLTPQTEGIVGAAALARLPDGALVVNVARGKLVDTDALVAETGSGRLRAALDVTDPEPLPPDHPLWRLPNVLISPHVGGASTAFAPRADRLVKEQLDRYARGEPLLNVVRAGSSGENVGRVTGRVVYASFATRNLSGGVAVHLQHIAMLRAAGIEASLWLPQPGTPAWMGDVPVVTGATIDLDADDLVLFPEAPVVPGVDPAPGARKIVFNQNHFYTYATWDGPLDAYPGWSPTPAVWAVSEESGRVLRALNPLLPVTVVPAPVDPGEFAPAARKAGVALLPKKRPHEAVLLRRLLEEDPRVPAGSVHVLADVPRAEVVRVLAESAVLVALSHTDSFGLPVAEALMSGCLVAGYDGGGGVDLFDAPGAWRVPEQRPLLLAERVIDLLVRRAELAPLAQANRAWVLERNGPAATAAALLGAVAEARTRPGARSVATHPATWLDRMPEGFTKTG